MMFADYLLCIDMVSDAIELLEQVRKENEGKMNENHIEMVILHMNFIAMRFSKGQFQKCREHVRYVTQNKKLLVKERGLEAAFYFDFINILIQVELEDWQYADYLLLKITKEYTLVLENRSSERLTYKIDLLNRIVKSQGFSKFKDLKSILKDTIDTSKYFPAGFEFISIDAWLLSKLNGMSYYENYKNVISKEDKELH